MLSLVYWGAEYVLLLNGRRGGAVAVIETPNLENLAYQKCLGLTSLDLLQQSVETLEPRRTTSLSTESPCSASTFRRHGLQQPLPKLVQHGAWNQTARRSSRQRRPDFAAAAAAPDGVLYSRPYSRPDALRRDRRTIKLHIETLLIDEQLSGVEQARLDQISNSNRRPLIRSSRRRRFSDDVAQCLPVSAIHGIGGRPWRAHSHQDAECRQNLAYRFRAA